MDALWSKPLTYLIGGMFLLALALFILSMIELRRARRGRYWRLRRQAGQRGGQLFLVSVTLFGLAAVIAFFSGFAAIALGSVFPSPTPTLTPSITPRIATPNVEGTVQAILIATAQQEGVTQTALARMTATPTLTLSPTFTVTATATSPPTPTITLTPTATFDLVLHFTPPPSTVQSRPDAAIGIVSASAEISPDQQPTAASETFPAGVQRIYFFIAYQNMDDGLTWSRVLYREGVPVQGGAYHWGLGEAGQSFFFFGREDGYAPGNYEVRVFLGIAEVSRFRFTVG